MNGYVVCPCSMSTAASIAAGAMANPVHRAASVALKEERKLVLVPRETPLSTIHLENLLRLRRAGATVVMAAPGFYHAPKTIDDLVNFVVARCLDQLEIDQTLVSRWGQEPPARLAPAAVEAMFDRISPVYDTMNRLMTAGLDRRWRRLTVRAVVRPGDRVLDARCGTGDRRSRRSAREEA